MSSPAPHGTVTLWSPYSGFSSWGWQRILIVIKRGRKGLPASESWQAEFLLQTQTDSPPAALLICKPSLTKGVSRVQVSLTQALR